MMSIHPYDVAPLFHAFGSAVFEAQHLEHGLQLLLKLIDEELKANGKKGVRLDIDSPNVSRKIGAIFEQVQHFEHFTDAERKIIQKGLKTRNFLVHSFWRDNRVEQTLTPDGRTAMIAELDRLRDQCRKAGRLVDSFIDRYLAKSGTSLGDLSQSLADRWEGDVPI